MKIIMSQKDIIEFDLILSKINNPNALTKHLNEKELSLSKNDYTIYRKKLCRRWGAQFFGIRLTLLASFMLNKATNRETTTYEELWSLYGAGSDKTVIHTVKAFSKLCKTYDLPPYTVLLKRKDSNKVGKGFFSPYGMENKTQEEKDKFEKECEQKCFSTTILSGQKLLAYLTTELINK